MVVDVLGLMLAKDEVDVVGDVLVSASKWCREIYVVDNGSTDGTWDVLAEVARARSNIVLVGCWDIPFHDGLRSELFRRYRKRARQDTWWARIDSDEFPVVDPRTVLQRTSPWFNAVHGSMYQYYLTNLDAEAYERDPEGWLATPLRTRIRWYENNWAEARFVRHATNARWGDMGWPERHHRTAPEEVPIRHFQYRSPEQIERRIAIRHAAGFLHERAESEPGVEAGAIEGWRSRLVPVTGLHYDDQLDPLWGGQSRSLGPRPLSRLSGAVAARAVDSVWSAREALLQRNSGSRA